MKTKKLQFIGGGRITNIFLHAFKNEELQFESITVSDTNAEVLSILKSAHPEIKTTTDNAKGLKLADVIFIALHPPVIMENLEAIKDSIKSNAIVISLAPKITIQKLIDMMLIILDCFV